MHINHKKRRKEPARDMTVGDLMVASVMTTTPSRTVGHVREVMAEHRVHAMPVADPDGQPVGIVTSTDLIGDVSEKTRVSQVMTRSVYTVPQYSDPSAAARIMRNHRIHHVVVTHEKKIVGIVSSFDLLVLVEDRRFVRKNPSTPKEKNLGPRTRAEAR